MCIRDSHRTVGRFRSSFLETEKIKNETEHFSVGFSIKPAIKTTFQRMRVCIRCCMCWYHVATRVGSEPKINRERKKWYSRFSGFAPKNVGRFPSFFLLLWAVKQNRPKKNASVCLFRLFGQPEKQLKKSIFGRENPTKADRNKRLSVFSVHIYNQPCPR